MKKYFLLLPLIMLLNHVAVAAEPPAIGYVDVRKVLLESKTGKKNKAEFEKMVKAKEAAIKKEEEKLKSMQEAFQKDQLMMTEDQKKARQKEFQEKAEAYQNMVRNAKQEVGKKDNEYTSRAMTEVRAIVADLAKEMKLSLVLEASETGLLYADEKMDLTPKVMEKYDAKGK
ncbi:MAG: OmpH family outer membrane protein [Pseudomonadota bacterium]